MEWLISNVPFTEATTMKTILAAIDFSPAADSVIHQGIQLAQALKTRLVVLHVIQPPVFIAGAGPVSDGAAVTAAAEKAADRRLAQLVAGLRKEYKRIETKRLTGLPVDLILEAASSLPAEHIVIGSHGHGAVYDLLVGSTASGILKRAKCPITIVPAVDRAAGGASPISARPASAETPEIRGAAGRPLRTADRRSRPAV